MYKMLGLNIRILKQILPVLLLCLGIFSVSCGDDDEDGGMNPGISCTGLAPSFSMDILPILNASCALSGCHEANFINGDFTGYDGVKSKVDNGSILERVVEDKEMPPPNSPGPTELTENEIQLINCWIESGAPNN